MSSTLTGNVFLLRPDGSPCAIAGCTLGPVSLDATGTWTIVIDGSGAATGSATVKLA